MASLVSKLSKRGLINPPNFINSNTQYEVVCGSTAYGTSIDDSDKDIYGWCIPPKEIIFPHIAGEILDFGKQKKRFKQYNPDKKVVDKENKVEYDLTIYNIIRYFQLCMENNPNMLDSLFVPQNCILFISAIGNMVRDKRKEFLHKGSWYKFKGYAYSQLHKMSGKNPEPGSKRALLREKYGFDVKFACHTVRLLYEAEMILKERDIDLQRHKEHLKAIRRGEVSEKDIREWSSEKEKYLEKVYEESKIPYGPDETKIKQLLVDCLEEHYGDLSSCVVNVDRDTQYMKEVSNLVDKWRKE